MLTVYTRDYVVVNRFYSEYSLNDRSLLIPS